MTAWWEPTYQWLRHPATFTSKAWREFRHLRDSTLKTARAWALKEMAMTLFTFRYAGAARRFFKRGYAWASRSRLQPVVEAARMLKRRLDNILTFTKHRLFGVHLVCGLFVLVRL